MSKQVVVLFLLLTSKAIIAQNSEQSEKDEVRQCINDLFESLDICDTAYLKEIDFVRSRPCAINHFDGSVYHGHRSYNFSDDLGSFLKTVLFETSLDFAIIVHERMATARTPFETRDNRNISLWISSTRKDGCWKITHVGYWVEKDDCEDIKVWRDQKGYYYFSD